MSESISRDHENDRPSLETHGKRTKTRACDLISRQAAIDAINALHDKPNAWLDCAVDAVMALPSAQPERTCETCRYNNRTWDMEPCDSCTIGGNDSHYMSHPHIRRSYDARIVSTGVSTNTSVENQSIHHIADLMQPTLEKTIFAVMQKGGKNE